MLENWIQKINQSRKNLCAFFSIMIPMPVWQTQTILSPAVFLHLWHQAICFCSFWLWHSAFSGNKLTSTRTPNLSISFRAPKTLLHSKAIFPMYLANWLIRRIEYSLLVIHASFCSRYQKITLSKLPSRIQMCCSTQASCHYCFWLIVVLRLRLRLICSHGKVKVLSRWNPWMRNHGNLQFLNHSRSLAYFWKKSMPSATSNRIDLQQYPRFQLGKTMQSKYVSILWLSFVIGLWKRIRKSLENCLVSQGLKTCLLTKARVNFLILQLHMHLRALSKTNLVFMIGNPSMVE